MKIKLYKLTLFFVFCFTFGLNAQWDQRPPTTFKPGYEQDFTGGSQTWDDSAFYGQWEAIQENIFEASDIANGYLKYEWIAKRILKSTNQYDTPNRIEADMMLAGGSNRGGLVLRIGAIGAGSVEDPQEPATGDPGFNRTGIAIYPSSDGSEMLVQFTGVPRSISDPMPVTRINVPLPVDVPNVLGTKYTLIAEDYGSSIYVFINDKPFFRIDLSDLDQGIYTSGSIIAPDESTLGAFTERHVPEKGKIAIAQRDANLQLYHVKLETTTEEQSISFDPIPKKLVSDAPFEVTAIASSGLVVELSVVSGPATISGNIVTLTGIPGVVSIAANQYGNADYAAAPEVINSFYVEDPAIGNLPASNQDYVDNWVVTDGLGRQLPTYGEVGANRSDKLVGVFYYTWHGFHGDKVYDITKILPNYPSDPLSDSNNAWGPQNHFHFWGEPEVGYYRSEDPWVIRRDLQMLSNAKVDFLYFDVTNGYTYLETVKAICDISLQMRLEGIATPKIVFTTHFSSGRVMNELYDDFYAGQLYEDLWFQWEGKPLILGDENDAELRPEVKSFFTTKNSWAWTNPRLANQWQWLDTYPQDYGWSTDPGVADQIPVAVASHPNNTKGTSYSGGSQPTVNSDYLTDYTGEGLHANEQWARALDVDPSIIMVTQWNEWLAQRFIWNQGNSTYAGRPIKNGDSYFVDAFTEEFNRDMAPMKGGHTDNFYYQLISNIRKFKGMAAPETFSGEQTISIDGSFDEWTDVTPIFKDPTGDVMHRDFAGYDPTVTYTNTTGRNDIVASRVTYDDDNIYFYAETANSITANTDQNWMLLFVDMDKDKNTGWEGYDWMINKLPVSSSETSLQKYEGGSWDTATTISYQVSGNEIEIAIPFTHLGISQGTTPEFHFKWADNPQNLDDVSAFFIDGDAAPDRRFNYNFDGSVTLGVDYNALSLEGLKVSPNPAKDRINISAIRTIKGITVYNLLGKEVFRASVNGLNYSADISDLKRGIYIVKLSTDNSLKTFKIIKQ
jgi:hypothetical protein